MLVAPPESELVGCCVCEFFEKLDVRLGDQNERDSATVVS